MNVESMDSLVTNPGFAGGGPEPDGWSYHSPRPELGLGYRMDSALDGSPALTLAATGDVRALGCWRGTADIKPNRWYHASVKVKLREIENPTLVCRR